MTQKQYDVIIVGGGIVGLVLACSLADSALKIAVLERAPLHKPDAEYDPRVFAITRSSQHVFQQLNVWSVMQALRVSPYQFMQVWDSSGNGDIQFDCREIGEPNLGHIIENYVIHSALLQRAKTHDAIDLLCPIKLTNLQRLNGLIQLTTEDGDCYNSPLVVGADGANSWLREQVGIQLRTWPYGHDGLVTTVKTSLPHNKTARQCFMPDGPLAFLPLDQSHTSSIVWSTNPERVDKLKNMSEENFKQHLANAFEHRLGEVESISARLSFPLHMRHAKQYVQEGIALVGDAAHTVHPLAGQGVNLGIADAAELAAVIKQSVSRQRNYAAYHNLRPYERQRKTDNLRMIAMMEGFKQLFSSKHPVAHWSRNIGLNMTNRFSPLKRQFMRHALGDKTVEFE